MAKPLDDDTIHAILSRAATLDGQSQLDRQLLERSAAELGISPEALQRAEAEIMAERANKEVELRFQEKLKGEFRENFIPYILVNAMLIGIWWFTGSNHFWPIYPILAWGFAVVMHWFTLNSRGSEYQHRFERFRAKEARRQQNKDSLSDRLGGARSVEDGEGVSDSF